MDIIPITTTPVNFGWAILLGLLGVGIVILSGALSDKKQQTSGLQAVLGTVGILMVLFAFMTGMVGSGGHEDTKKWVSDVQSAVEERYGIELTQSEVLELDFPTERPDDDFVEYGTISKTKKSGDGYDRHHTTLIWDGDRLLLAGSVDGEEFTELDR